MDQWLNRCPVKQFRERLVQEKLMTEQTGKAIEANVKASIEEAVQFGMESPFPSPEEAVQDLFG
jgi:pyruvate dehydrogenase E1 component alpha subunit